MINTALQPVPIRSIHCFNHIIHNNHLRLKKGGRYALEN